MVYAHDVFCTTTTYLHTSTSAFAVMANSLTRNVTDKSRNALKDKPLFELSSDDQWIYVCMHLRQLWDTHLTGIRPTARKPGLMVWDAILLDNRTLLVVILDNLTAWGLFNDTLHLIVLFFLSRQSMHTFQQEWPLHIVTISIDSVIEQFLGQLHLPNFPPREHVWWPGISNHFRISTV